jgi:hypothetical protein
MLDERFRSLRATRAPELWPDIEHREPRQPRREITWSRLGTVAVAFAVAAAGFAIAYRAFEVEEADPRNVSPSPTAEPLPPLTGVPQITAEVPFPKDAVGGGVAVGAGSAWVGITHNGGKGPSSVLRIDLSTNRVVDEIPVQQAPQRERIVATDDAVWIGSSGGIERIDPSTDNVVARIDAPGFISAMAADAMGVWAIAILDRSDSGLQNTGTLLRVDPATNEVIAEIPLGTHATGYEDELELGSGSVWVLGPRLVDMDTEKGGDLIRVDPTTNEITAAIPVSGFSMAAGVDAVWVSGPVDGVNDEYGEPWGVVVVDSATNEVSRKGPFDHGLEVATSEALWSVDYDRNLNVRATRFDPQTLEMESRSDPIESYFTDAVVDPRTRTIWVSALKALVRIDITAS